MINKTIYKEIVNNTDESINIPDQIIKIVNSSKKQIDPERVTGLADFLKETDIRIRNQAVQALPITTALINGKRAKNLNFTGITPTFTGDTVTIPITAGSGTVTDVSVATANGISGSVATSTTTPAITLNISALDATKIADGSVTNAEFQYIGGLTSDAQTQINGKQASMGADDNYVTDAQLVVIGNTSGTNTGDNAANSSSLALTGGTMTGNITLGAAKQIILTAPSADVTCTGVSTSAFNSGYSSSAVGDLVYLDSSATWQKVDADAIATSGGMLGIALEVKASGNALLVALPGSFVRVNAWAWTPGTTLYCSETAGGIATAIPTGADGVIRVIGWACNADYIFFNPSSDNSTVVA